MFEHLRKRDDYELDPRTVLYQIYLERIQNDLKWYETIRDSITNFFAKVLM